MARKFLQMGWTRARRYANHKSRRKHDASKKILPRKQDTVSAEAAAVLYKLYVKDRENRRYRAMKEVHLAQFERTD